MPAKQIQGFEALRGLCAIAVALYHCLAWSGAAFNYNWGMYGVYIFFVISGAVLYHNYSVLPQVGPFLLKRFARLVPLYALVTVVTAIGLAQSLDWKHLLNVSMLFGLSNPGGTSTVAGGWSLGIEFLLYLLFPALLALMNSPRVFLPALLGFFLLRIATVESIVVGPVEDWWQGYTQVGSFLFFFFGGMVIAKVMREATVHRYVLWAVAAVSAAVIFAVPMRELILTEWIGLAYSALCLVVVAGFYAVKLPGSKFLGEISYGLYLLHPVVWGALHRVFGLSVPWRIALTIPLAAAAAWLILRLYEQPMRRWIISLAQPDVHGHTPRP